MKRAEDYSILLTDKNFQKILSDWKDFSEEQKAVICSKYDLSANDVHVLQQLWLGLDFHRFELSNEIIEDALDKTIWKLTESNSIPAKQTPARKLYEQFSRIAAILIVPIIIYTGYIQFFKISPSVQEIMPQMITVNSQSGTITKLILPDGSKISLNSGSSISYPNYFNGNTREVSLMGEAYFEVVKNKKNPMVVSAGNSRLKVYGTSFNANAFPSENFIKVTLVEGSISLSSSSGKLKGEDEFFIEPGQTVTFFDESKDLIVQNDDPFIYTAWKDGLLVFRNKTFENVLTQLSRKFNIDIELKDPSLASIPMDATFIDENINEILRLLSLSTPFSYYYESPKKLADGTFLKSKIYIVKTTK